MYLSYIEPLDKKSKTGKETLIVLRDKRKSLILKQDVPHLAVTKPLSYESAIELYEELNSPKYSDLQKIAYFDIKDYFGKGKVIRAIGSRKMKDFLPKHFHKKEYSPTQMLHYKFPILSKIVLDNEMINVEKTTRQVLEKILEEVMFEKVVALDIENHLDTNEIYSAALFSGDLEFGNYLFHLFPLKDEEISVKTEFGTFPFFLYRCKDENEIGLCLTKLIQDYDPFVIALHWAQHDLKLLRTLKGKISDEEKITRKKLEKEGFKTCYDVFAPGVLFSKVRFEGSMAEASKGKPTKIQIAGRQLYDGAGTSQYFYATKNNKLATKTAYFYDVAIEKEDYSLIDKEAKDARAGNDEVARKRLNYNASDVVYTYFNFEKEKMPLFLGMMLFNADMPQLCMTSKNKLAQERWKEKEFYRIKTFFYPTIEDEQSLNQIDMEQEKILMFKNFLEKENKNIDFRKGIFDVDILYPLTFIKTFKSTIQADAKASFVYDKMMQSSDIDIKLMLAQQLNSWLLLPWFEYKKFMSESKLDTLEWISSPFDINNLMSKKDFVYGKKFSIVPFQEMRENEFKQSWIMTINNNLLNFFSELTTLIEDSEIINYGRRFLYVRSDKKEILEKLIEKELAFHFGNGKALSVEKNRIVSVIKGKATKMISEGIELGTKNLPYRCDVEKKTIEDFCTLALIEGKEKALSYLKWIEEKLKKRSFSKEQLYFETKRARLNWFDYFAEDDRIKALKKYKIMEGEQFKGIYIKGKEGMSIEEEEDDIDYERYLEKFLTTMKPFVEAVKS